MGIRARNLDPASALRYVDITETPNLPANATVSNLALGIWMFTLKSPFRQGTKNPAYAKIIDVLIWQTTAGVAGTSVSVNILKNNSTSIWGTQPVIALAGGANTGFDTLGELTLPTGATRGIFTTTAANLILAKGDELTLTTTTVGAYTTAPGLGICIVLDPFPL